MRLDAPPIVSRRPSIVGVLRAPAVRSSVVAVIALGATISMFEPVFALFLGSRIHLGPARIGLVFGGAALVNIAAHPLFGQLAGRTGARRLTIGGLVSIAVTLPFLALTTSFWSAIFYSIVTNLAISATVTPSLALMGEAVSSSGTDSFGLAYGLYNFAWAIGLFAGPAVGGFMFERLGLALLTLIWAPSLLATTALAFRMVARDRSPTVEAERQRNHV
jgi:MFS family permease